MSINWILQFVSLIVALCIVILSLRKQPFHLAPLEYQAFLGGVSGREGGGKSEAKKEESYLKSPLP